MFGGQIALSGTVGLVSTEKISEFGWDSTLNLYSSVRLTRSMAFGAVPFVLN